MPLKSEARAASFARASAGIPLGPGREQRQRGDLRLEKLKKLRLTMVATAVEKVDYGK